MVLRASSWVLLLRLASLLALGTSVALLLDYVRPDPAFCGLDSGCGAVRGSGFGYLPFFGMGVLPVPALGVLVYGLLYSSTFLRSFEARERIGAPLALSGAVVATVLIGIQAYIGHFCSLCMIVDSSAIACGIAAFALRRGGGFEEAFNEEKSGSTVLDPQALMSEGQRVKGVWRDDSQVYDAPNPLVVPVPKAPFRLTPFGWISLSTMAVLAPLLFPTFVQTSKVPAIVRALYHPEQPTIVEFFDFQCPHCRDLSPRLKVIAQQENARIRYGYTPLPSNPDSRVAARVAICAAEQGREAEVTSAFFTDLDLSRDHVLDLAQKLVADPKALQACLKSDVPDARIKQDTEIIQGAGFEGLPTTYIGATRILGAQPDAVYYDAIRRLREGNDGDGMPPWMYWAGVLAMALAVVLLTRIPPPNPQSLPS